jgi:uncharacterized protein (TIGR04222 family)
VARSVVFALMQKGLIEFKTTGKTTQIERTANQPPRLNQIEQIALDWLKNSRDSKDIFQANGLVTQLEAYGDAFKMRLAQQQMLVGEDLEDKLSRWKWLVILVIAGLGGYKILAAFSHGKLNVFGIIIIGAVGLIIAFVMSSLPRLTKLGTAYLERLQLAFDSLKNQTQQVYMPSGAPKVMPSATFAGVDPLLLSVGVFGAGILAGTVYNEYNNAFSRANQQAATSSGSCSAGCGSGCSSGSSDSSGSSSSSGSSCSSGCGGGCGGCS